MNKSERQGFRESDGDTGGTNSGSTGRCDPTTPKNPYFQFSSTPYEGEPEVEAASRKREEERGDSEETRNKDERREKETLTRFSIGETDDDTQ